MDENLEMVIFNIINYGGTAKGLAYEALDAAINKDYELSDKLMKEADESLVQAHQVQTDIIQAEAAGKKTEVTVLFVHAQDHLMSAIEAKSLIEYLIKMHKRIDALEAEE